MAQSTIPGVLPSTKEHMAASNPFTAFSKVRHTGTDAISYESGVPSDPLNGNTLQVMTWDEGNQVYLAWDVFQDLPTATSPNTPLPGISSPPAKGALLLPINAPDPGDGGPDPDVVLAYYTNPITGNTDLYANLVYIANKHIQYAVYRWDVGNRTFAIVPNYPVQLGDSKYDHSYPNVDANSKGLVAVTWQQTINDVVKVSVTSTHSYFAPYTFKQNVSFGRAVVAGGNIVGDFRPCYKDPQAGTMGLYVVNPPTGLFEQTLHPDVAISEESPDSAAVVSVTFIRHFVDGADLFSIVNKLAVVQTYYDLCGTTKGNDDDPSNPNNNIVRLRVYKQYEWDYSSNEVVGTPRIAATSLPREYRNYGTDVEVAVDRTRSDCGPGQYEIRNYGKSIGLWRKEYTLVSPAGNPNTLPSVEPAISYSWATPNRNGTTGNDYIISWAGGPGYYSNSLGEDVWAVSLKEGRYPTNGTSGPSAQPNFYSRVNFNGDGRQAVPSIAGRYLIGDYIAKPDDESIAAGQTPGGIPLVHLFFDAAKNQVSYRRTGASAGTSNPLRPALGTGTGLLVAYPNPSENEVTLHLDLQKGETVRSVRVFDAVGRSVANLVHTPSAEGNIVWKPADNLPVGTYTVRVETSKRTANTVVTRK